jgi:xanthine dehydrogenase YagR molybdenum-binding subunit
MTPTTSHASIGRPRPRTEGPLKVTGVARYAFEHETAGAVYCWPVQSTISRGVVLGVAADALLARDDVLAVLWHGNAQKLEDGDDAELAVLQSSAVAYRGQLVAAVVATTLEGARDAAAVLEVTYEERAHDVVLRTDHPDVYAPEQVNAGFATDSVTGAPDEALLAAAHRIDETYSTPGLHNSPMEPHATVARWDGDRLTVWDSTQHSSGVQQTLATMFALEPDDVHVIAEHVGGGFGSKGSARPNAVLAAMAARAAGATVKLALPRQAMFALVGYRTPTIQRVQLGADAEGRLTAFTHDAFSQTSRIEEFAEQTAEGSRHSYAAPHRRTTHRLLALDVPTPRWMRAPGEAPGYFAVESALDELAAQIGIDPIDLRVANEPEVDPDSGNPYSSRNLVACLRQGAERFGWDERDPRPGRRREGRKLIGMGVASASYPAMTQPSTAQVRGEADGRWIVSIAAADIGNGSRTVLGQIAADVLDVDADRVEVRLGDSALPTASVAGGSSGTSSWGWAVTRACEAASNRLAELGGTVPDEGLEVTADTSAELEELEPFARHAYGAHFAEVEVDVDTGEVRVRRFLGLYAVGRIMNARTARSQFIGGITFGIGMALTEEGVMDPRFGDYVNHDLAEYHVPACADIQDIEVDWIDEPDEHLNPMGGKGIGEIGIVGSPAAIANAVHNACGVRIRELPLRLEKVLDALDPALRD